MFARQRAPDPPPWTPSFDLAGSDVALRSCDGHLFRVHRKNLAASSRTFDDMFTVAGEPGAEPVPLTETGKLVDRLLCFFYDERYPDVRGIPFEEGVDLAECARKYQMAALTALMRVHLFHQLKDFSAPKGGKTLGQRIVEGYDRGALTCLPRKSSVLTVFQLAHDLGYWDLVNTAALFLVDVAPEGPAPEELHAATWEKLRNFNARRRGAVLSTLAQSNSLVAPFMGKALCDGGCRQLICSVAVLHVDPLLAVPQGCPRKDHPCKGVLQALANRIEGRMPSLTTLR